MGARSLRLYGLAAAGALLAALAIPLVRHARRPRAAGSGRARSTANVAPLETGRWLPRGPGGGGALFSPVISPFDARDVFLESDMTDVFRSRDFGDRWAAIDFRQLQGDSFGKVQYTSDPRVLYALSGEGDRAFLARSADGGETFQELAGARLAEPARYLFASPRSSGTFVCADAARVYVSRDGGASLAPVYSCASEGGCVLGGAFFGADATYLATTDGVLASPGDGAPFTMDRHGGIPAGERIVALAGAQRGDEVRLLAVTYRAGEAPLRTGMTSGDPGAYGAIYRLDPRRDGAWVKVTRGIGAEARLGLVAMASSDPDIAYLAGKDARSEAPVVYRTSNGGDDWTSTFRTAANDNVDTGWEGERGDAPWSFGEVALGLAVAPNDPSRVVMSDLAFVHVSRDGGESWQAAYVAPSDRHPRGHPTPAGDACATSGIDPTSVWSLAFPAPGVVFAAVTDIRSARSEDGGRSWRRASADGLKLNTTYAAVSDPATGALYAATSSVHDLFQNPYLQDERIDGGRGAVMVSMDAGASFTPLFDLGHPVVWLGLDPTDAKRLYASVVHSREGGLYAIDLAAPDRAAAAVHRLPSPPRTEGHPYTFQVLHDGAIVASYSARREASVRGVRGPFTPSSGVFLLRAGASGWEDVSAPAMRYFTKDVVVDPHDRTESTWYAAVFEHERGDGSGGLYRTRDRGRSWKRIADRPRVESCTPHPTDPSVLFMTTETEGLFVTRDLLDDEPVFRPVDAYPFRQPLRLFFDPRDPHELWATSFGGGIRASRVE